MTEKPKYAIINDTDRPCRDLIVECIDGKYYYMSRAYDKNKHGYDGMDQPFPTNMADFGFDIVENMEKKTVTFVNNRNGKARYRDGKPRAWQEHIMVQSFTMPMVDLSYQIKRD